MVKLNIDQAVADARAFENWTSSLDVKRILT